MEHHSFTKIILQILNHYFLADALDIFEKSELLKYINIKTRSAEKEAKARASFGNIYAIYVLLEDYCLKNFHNSGNYSSYEGAIFSNLFKRQRELPFGQKLQNHALNHRLNEEFKKYFPTCDYIPIIRNTETSRYWFNENLLKIYINGKIYNIAEPIIQIINKYIEIKQASLNDFLTTCKFIGKCHTHKDIENFIRKLLAPNTDARLFEIVSFSILKYYYLSQYVYFGFSKDELNKENLHLFKTGRTNANDGGIDFVMKPLGRFYQVTETLDFKKYFLDIDKIERYPITFVIKSNDDEKTIMENIKTCALNSYGILSIVDKYMNCIEEIFNIPKLIHVFDIVVEQNNLNDVLQEIILQCKMEFNIQEEVDTEMEI